MEYYLVAAILSAFFYGVGILGEKSFIEHHTSVSEWTLVFFSTSIFALFSFSLVPFNPIRFSFNSNLWVIFLATGGLYAGAMILWFYAMNRESASKVGQLASLESVITPLFGIIFLSETPSQYALFGIFLIASGLLLLVFDRGLAKAIVTTKVAVIPIFICLLMWATQDTLIKIALTQENFWTVFFWTRVVSFGFFASLIFKPSVRSDLKTFFDGFFSEKTYVLFIAKVVTSFGLLSAVLAMSLGPLSVVAPILASYPLFVFCIGLAITKLTNIEIERAEKGSIIKRSVSLGLFVCGVFVLYVLN